MSFITNITSLWAKTAPPKAPEPTAEQKHNRFIDDVTSFFDLPWDAAKKMQGASVDVMQDIARIYDYSHREDARHRAPAGYIVAPPLYWQWRRDHAKMVMEKLDYTPEETARYAHVLVTKHAAHFSPLTRSVAFKALS